ncbi:hypothetical protein OK074_1011 [Actinobacteria bacterium OK074]|nr:hypothetical protein OK074_1011 [Actinobacteria bacterium OK074]
MQPEMLSAVTEALPLSRPDRPDRLDGPDAAPPGGALLVGYESGEELAAFAARPGWRVHVPGHPDEVRHTVRTVAVRDGHAYVHVSAWHNAEPRAVTEDFQVVREGLGGVVLAVGAALDPVLRATAGLDLCVLYATTVRPFDEVGLRTAVLAADHADVVLAEPYRRGTCAAQVADTLVHVPHRLLALGAPDGLDERRLARAVREFLR